MQDLNKIIAKSGVRMFAVTLGVALIAAACGQAPEKASRRTASTPHGNDEANPVLPGDEVVDGADDVVKKDDKKKDDDKKTEEKPEPETDIKKIMTSAGLRNYEQINATMSTVTGIPSGTTAVNTLYRTELATALPTDNDIKAFLGSNQVAVFKLAVEYCDALVKDTTRRGAVFGAFNFAAAPGVALNAAGKDALADALVSKFWGKDLESLPPFTESTDQVVALIDDLLVGKNLNTVAITSAVVTATCTAVLASAPVTMF